MIVVTDTSVILNLCVIEKIGVLPCLFKEILCPDSVRAEFESLAGRDPRFAKMVFPGFINVVSVREIRPELTDIHRLHQGEKDAISLALELNADALLIDERAGRDAVAALGLRSIGILGILLQAKVEGLLESISPVLNQLQSEAGFWLAPTLVSQVLKQAGEQ